jgi:acyl-coenzyme A thioesterase PaaI-like protein
LRRATGTITTPGGHVLATFSGVCVVVPAAGPASGAMEVPPPVVVADARDHPGGLAPGEDECSGIVALGTPVHPLLAALDAAVRSDGDRTWVRFRPAGWLANVTGGVHVAAGGAIADATATAALERVLPAGSATGVLSADLTVVRSTPMDADVEAAATVRHVGRRLAVVDIETNPTGCRPSVLARMTIARTTCR